MECINAEEKELRCKTLTSQVFRWAGRPEVSSGESQQNHLLMEAEREASSNGDGQ